MTIILYQPPGRPWGMPNFSPFCTKLETYLRMAEIPHEVRDADPRGAPKGKMPYAELDGRPVADSQVIIDALAPSHRGLDAHLTPEQQATGHCVRRMLEEATYFVVLYARWLDEESFRVLAPEFGKLFPAVLRPILFPIIRRKIRSTLQLQGTGRHALADACAGGARDFDAISAILGANEYLLGDRPSSYDATVFAFLEATLGFPYDSPLRVHVAGKTNLVAYRARMRGRYFPELEEQAPSVREQAA